MADTLFQCSFGSTDLCFNGGYCDVNSSSGPRCICPDGWGPDLWFFHNYNCAMPFGPAIAYVVFDWTCNLIGALLIGQAYRRHIARPKPISVMEQVNHEYVSDVYKAAIPALIVYCGVSGGILFQDGYYEVSSIFHALFIFLDGLWVNNFGRLLLLPYFPRDQDVEALRAINNRSRMVWRLMHFLTLPFTITQIFVCRTSDRIFNIMQAGLHIAMWVYIVIISVTTYIVVTQLRKRLAAGLAEGTYKDVEQKLNEIITAQMVLTAYLIPLLLTWPIVLFVLGSAPFYWVVTIPSSVINTIGIIRQTLTVGRAKTTDSTSSLSQNPDSINRSMVTNIVDKTTIPLNGTLVASL